jgi:hypothetical protein
MLPFAIIGLFLLLIVYYIIRLLFLYIQSTPSQTSNFINPIFGNITPPKIKNASFTKPPTLVLDTIEGQPVTATESAQVYYLPPVSTKLGYRQKVNAMARQMGFNTDITGYTLVNDSEAQFRDASQEASIDITNFNFTYQYNIKDNPNIFSAAVIPVKNQIENKAVDYLVSIDNYPEELARGKTNVLYIRYDPITEQLGVVDSPEGANMVEVDFYRPDIDVYPIVSPSYFNSQNYVVMVFKSDLDATVIKSQIKHFNKSEEQVGIYPVKTGDVAWEDMKNGKGFVISSVGDMPQIKISKMFLGYLDPDIYQEYLQPVYVFLGDNNFVGYVPAIQDSYFIKN